MSDPHAPRRVSATIKFPQSKPHAADNPWLVFEGSVESVREQVIEAFGFEDDDLTLFDVVTNAQGVASNINSVVQKLGGKVINEAKEDAKSASESPAASPAPNPPAEEDDGTDKHVKGLIEAATSMDELSDIWARYRNKIEGTPLFELMGERSKSLA